MYKSTVAHPGTKKREASGGIQKVLEEFPPHLRAGRDLPALLQQHYVSPAQPGQVVGHGCPHDASSTDHHTGLAGQWKRLGVPTDCQAPRRGPEAPAGQPEARLREQQPGQQGGGQSPGAPHAAAHNRAFCGRTQSRTRQNKLKSKLVGVVFSPHFLKPKVSHLVTPFSGH